MASEHVRRQSELRAGLDAADWKGEGYSVLIPTLLSGASETERMLYQGASHWEAEERLVHNELRKNGQRYCSEKAKMKYVREGNFLPFWEQL